MENIVSVSAGLFEHAEVADFVGHSAGKVAEESFPSGFYRFARRSFIHDDMYVQGLAYVYRRDDHTFLRGFEAKQAMADQGLPTAPNQREFRAVVMPQEDGVALMLSRRGAQTASFNYLARVPSFENNFWVGYVTRTVREDVAGRRVERQVVEHLGRNTGKVLAAARTVGFCGIEDVLPYLRQMLKPGEPFS
ncbi:XRE family transcriptional regulator [Pacificoceanicola onchidii]|uniref:XRE family transcriptional regulator n=1 Tax=Pacificoceanicola onchidii TaxID=2562685 RepID=UPI0030B8986F